MKRPFTSHLAAIAFAFSALLAPAAHAQLFRAYLSINGSDANPCTLPAPCRLLPAAINAVASGGEVWMVNSANYNTGTVTVAKSVSILAIPGVVGSLVSAAEFQPALQVVDPGLQVTLRNLVVTGLPTVGNANGVLVQGASRMNVEGCVFSNMLGNALRVTDGAEVMVRNSTFRYVGVGVNVRNAGNATVTESSFFDAGNGIFIDGNAAQTGTATVSDSVISSATSAGVFLFPSALGGVARAFLTRVTVNGMAAGALAVNAQGASSATITLEASTIVGSTGAGYSIFGAGASVVSLGNNLIADNGSNTGSLTPAALR